MTYFLVGVIKTFGNDSKVFYYWHDLKRISCQHKCLNFYLIVVFIHC